jgi:hypothetical protein
MFGRPPKQLKEECMVDEQYLQQSVDSMQLHYVVFPESKSINPFGKHQTIKKAESCLHEKNSAKLVHFDTASN